MSDEQHERIPGESENAQSSRLNFSFEPAPETVAFIAAILMGAHGRTDVATYVTKAIEICTEVERRVQSGEIKV